jgi:hypothetical protein
VPPIDLVGGSPDCPAVNPSQRASAAQEARSP